MPPKGDLSLDKITADILAMESNNEPAKKIADYIASRFQTNQNFRIPTAKNIKDDTLRKKVIESLESLKNKEVEIATESSKIERENLATKVDTIQLGMQCLLNEFPNENLRERLYSETDQSNWGHKIYQTLQKKGISHENIQIIVRNIKSSNPEHFLQNPNETAFEDRFTVQNPNLTENQIKHEIFSTDKLSFQDSINEDMEINENEKMRKNLLSSLASHLGDPSHQSEYWRSAKKTPFIDGKATPTCAAAITWHFQKLGLKVPKLSAAAKSFAKGNTKKKDKWRPGDLVVYNTRKDKNGNVVGGHIGVFVGWENGVPMVWSENIGVDKRGYIGPFIHPMNDLEQVGISDPHVYGLENFIPQREKVIKFD